MPREKKADKLARALEVARRMEEHYPASEPALHFDSPFTLTIAVLLSAQTTDAAVNKATPELFKHYGTPEKMAQAPLAHVEEIIHSLGFYHSKARHCIECAQMIMSDFGGEVPQTMAELQRLPGVGRKTANIVMNVGFGKVEGVAVDTHVFRIARKLRFSAKKTPTEVEKDLLKLYPQEYWEPINSQWILFGREVCIARRPQCAACFLADICPSAGK